MVSDQAQLGQILLTASYPKYSRVLGYQEFLQMVEGFKAK